jgi:hypothetical protein
MSAWGLSCSTSRWPRPPCPPAEVAVALRALLGNLEAAQEVLDTESRRPGGLGYPEAAGILRSILDNRARVLGKLARDLGR